MDNGRKVVTVAHPKLCSGELKTKSLIQYRMSGVNGIVFVRTLRMTDSDYFGARRLDGI